MDRMPVETPKPAGPQPIQWERWIIRGTLYLILAASIAEWFRMQGNVGRDVTLGFALALIGLAASLRR